MNELSAILSQTMDRLLVDHVCKETLRASEDGVRPAARWQALEENGLTQPLIPEDRGGIGAGWSDAFIIVQATGYSYPPVPLAETLAAGWLLSQSSLDVPEGPITLIDDGHGLTSKEQMADGQASAVPWGRHVAHAVALTNDNDRWRICVIETENAKTTPDMSIAREPRDHVVFNGASGVSAAFPTAADNSPARLLGALVRSAQMAGAMRKALDMTVQYATERLQFGRRIAKFQAIQHMLAVTAAKVAEAHTAAEYAFRAMDSADGYLSFATFAIASAKVVCGEAVEQVADAVHEVHGAIGFTEEHDLHFTTRRLWSWRGEFGTEAFWAEELGRKALSRGAENLWPDLTAHQAEY